MEVDTETTPSYYDPENLSGRELYRRYGKRQSGSCISPYHDISSSKISESRRSNTALYLEDIKQEADSVYYRDGIPSRSHSAYKRRSPDSHEMSDLDFVTDASHPGGSHLLKTCKIEEDVSSDAGETTFSIFASLLDSTLQGMISIPDLILRFEQSCRDVSESIRYGSDERHRILEDRSIRQRAQILLDEAASWSLLWHLYGKATEEIPEGLVMYPTTSHLEACQFVATNLRAELCLRIVQWLEGLASKALDLEIKVRGSHVGTYIPRSGIWHNTQKHLRASSGHSDTISHLDFDAPTRENALPLPDDRKLDESLLEDVWTLLRAGRLKEACELCRSAGQPWRAATLSPFGGLDHVPSVEALIKNGKDRTLQAIELENGIGRQWRLWRWASYSASERIAEKDGEKYEIAIYAAQSGNLKRVIPVCRDWESACWAMSKSWLDVLVDMELARLQPGWAEHFKIFEDNLDESPSSRNGSSPQTVGPESWPMQVLNQQPRDIFSLLQKLHSGELVHEAVTHGCKEQHRQIEMNLMKGHIPNLLELLWSWISPSDDTHTAFRPHGDPQVIRFSAHLVLVLRYLLEGQGDEAFKETMRNIGDLIIHMYCMFLFTKQHEELVGIYASQLARHRCIDLFVHMMELRLSASIHVKYKLFMTAMEHLPFSPGDNSKGSFEEIIERVLSRSREIKISKYDGSSDVAEQHRLQSFEKAMVIQWLCFTPPSTVSDVQAISGKLNLLALMHSNILFREFALISMWRVPSMPIGAHQLLSFLAEPLKQPSDELLHFEDVGVSNSLEEFSDWNEYYSCDATYRNWLKIDLENADISPLDLSLEEKQRAVIAAKEMLRSSLLLLQRAESSWLVPTEDQIIETAESVFIELHATAMICSPSGECMTPDATICATLMSALYSSVTEDVVLNRQLMVNVKVSPWDCYSIQVVLRCLAVPGDGFGPNELCDGGILATIMASGFKGQLSRFQAGVTMDISRLDAWYSDADGELEDPATYIVKGLCRRCCLPELILRCMQVSVSLSEMGELPKSHNQLIELVGCPETGFLNLFSQQQLQEFLLFEREYSIRQMEFQEQADRLFPLD